MGGVRKASSYRQHLAGAFQKDAAGRSQEEKLRAENSTCRGPGGGPLGESYRVHAGQGREEKEGRVHITRDFTDSWDSSGRQGCTVKDSKLESPRPDLTVRDQPGSGGD